MGSINRWQQEMIIPKILINSVATALTKHFKLDKIMSYVFDDNELDREVKKLKKENIQMKDDIQFLKQLYIKEK